MERKHFLSLLGLGVAGISFGKYLKTTFPNYSNVLVLFVGEYISESSYKYAIENGFKCCQVLANKKGISKRKDMENLIIGREIKDYEFVMEDKNWYWITKETADLAAQKSEKEIRELLGRGFTDIVFVVNFVCSTAVGALKRILMFMSNPKIKIHSVASYSCLFNEEEKRFQQFVLKIYSHNYFVCDITTHPDYSPYMSFAKGDELEERIFTNEFKACLKQVLNDKR